MTLDAHKIIPFHAAPPPQRSVCRGSMDDATVIVAMLATARAEAALAEREACMADVRLLTVEPNFTLNSSGAMYTEQIDAEVTLGALHAAIDAINARTTPATLGTDTLAAFVEARGFRMVAPDRLVTIEQARAEGAAEAFEACARIAGDVEEINRTALDKMLDPTNASIRAVEACIETAASIARKISEQKDVMK